MRSLTGPTFLLVALGCCGTTGRAPRPAGLDPSDRDRDGERAVAAGGFDCADHDPRVHPGAEERCDGIDDDCDALVDEEFQCVAGSEQACDGGTRACTSDCRLGECRVVTPCGVDTSVCQPGDVAACDSACPGSTQGCTPGCTWGPCQPPAESCNGLDDDCDDEVDEGLWGLASGLHEVGTTIWVGKRALAMVGPTAAFAYESLPGTIEVVWVGDEGIVGAPILAWDEPDLWYLGGAVAMGEDAVFSAAIGDLVDVVVVSPDEVRASWTFDRWDRPSPLLWTGSELLVLDGPWLHAFTADGVEVREAVRLPYDEHGNGAWTDEGLVLAVRSGVSWLDSTGAETRRTELDAIGVVRLGASTAGLLAAGFDGTSWVTTKLSPGGVVEWSRNATTPRPFSVQSVHAVAGGWLVVAAPFGGWWLSEDGGTSSPPTPWLPAGSLYEFEVAGSGESLWIGTTERSVAKLGCVSQNQEVGQ